MANSAPKETALWVIRTLREAGHQALLAGGCVRDMLLGREATDYDVATDATPRQVQKLFHRVLMVGAQFGVAMVVRNKQTVEVATFRDDLSYTDGRRPDGVRFSDARSDAMRRDFTINGMFLDPIDEEVIDYVGGQADLQAGLIRAIGDPAERLAEDYLRLLRAVRFAARFQFEIEPATAAAVADQAANLDRISGERIREELEKMFSAPHGLAAMTLAHDLGLIDPIFGPASAEEEAWAVITDRLDRLADRRDVVLSLVCLLAASTPGEVRRRLRRWGSSNELIGQILGLLERLDQWREAADWPLPQFKRLMALDIFDRLQLLWQAEESRLTGTDEQCRRIADRAGQIDPAQVAPAPLVTGDDLIEMGLTEGRRLGKILRALYDLQLDEKLLTRDAAMETARQWIAEG